MSGSAAHRRAGRIAGWLFGAVALFVSLTIVPTQEYMPTCGGRYGVAVKGPLREQYLEMLVEYMARENFTHLRRGDTILVPLLPIFDGSKHFRNWREFAVNHEWKLASAVAEGVTLQGRFFPPPEPLVRLLGSRAPDGEFFTRRRNGRVFHGSDPRFKDDCELFRAAVLKVEAMPSEAPPDPGAIDRARHARTAETPPASGPAPQRP